MSAPTRSFDRAGRRHDDAPWTAIPSYLDRRGGTKATLTMGFSFAAGSLATMRWSCAANEGSAYTHALTRAA